MTKQRKKLRRKTKYNRYGLNLRRLAHRYNNARRRRKAEHWINRIHAYEDKHRTPFLWDIDNMFD